MLRSVRARSSNPARLAAVLCMFTWGCSNGAASPAQERASRPVITPDSVSLPPGGSVTFVAAGAPAESVDWSASAGSITSAGLYTAPAELGTYRIQATSGGLSGVAIANVVPAGSPGALHAAASSTCASMPLRSTGTVHYFCDCQDGAEAGCVAGDDDFNDGLSSTTPKRTWTAAVNAFNAMNAGDTVALCKGGFWRVPAGADATGGTCGYAPAAPSLANARCAPGTSLSAPANASTCDLRDYQAPWGGTARPVLHAYQSGTTYLVNRNSGTTAGVRVLNLEFRGSNAGPRGGIYSDHRGISFNACNYGTDDSWLICNNVFTHLRLGIIWDGKSTDRAIDIRGNRFLMNDLDGTLGAPGAGARIDANFFDDNGGFIHPVTGNAAHSVYLSGEPPAESSGLQVVNNEFRRGGSGSTPGVSVAGVLVGHEYYDRVNIENNIIDCGAGATNSCWAVDLRAAGSPPTHYRHMTFRRNRVIGGGLGISIGQAPGVVIENNVVTLLASGWNVGIASPQDVARPAGTVPGFSGGDDVEDDATIRNNTIYMPLANAAGVGISVGVEGTGHVIANNAVYTGGGTCFSTPLAASAYAFVGNNACRGGTWGTAYDTTTHVTDDPRFAGAPADFTPGPGSPLIGAGDAAHAPPTDLALQARPASPSIGALEP